jgi:hypothetical protein
MPISANGGPWGNNGSLLNTLTVIPVTAGDLLVFAFQADATAASSSVSGGGVTTWHEATGWLDTGFSRLDEIWWGVITATGSSVITVTNSSLTNWGRVFAREYTGVASWALLAASPSVPSSGGSTGSGLTVNYPSLTGSGLYCGTGDSLFGSMTGGTTTGFTYDNNNAHQEFAWDASAINAAPVSTQDNTGAYEAIAALFGAAPAFGSPLSPRLPNIPVLAVSNAGWRNAGHSR